MARRKLTAAVQHALMQPSITTHSCANAEPMQDGLKLQSCVVESLETAAHLRLRSA